MNPVGSVSATHTAIKKQIHFEIREKILNRLKERGILNASYGKEKQG